jgi:formylglycine-generating enzyme required for sulfatase activity
MITTFYSFKGGVGRSMAMANVAYELASRGLRVLAVDFDLEAPGLERYFRVPVSTVHATPGVIDLIEQYKRALSGSGEIGPEAEFRQLQRYICPIAEFGGSGRLDLMPAGRRASDDDRRAYALAVRTFDWQDFYFNWEGEAFFEWLRKRLVGTDDAGGLYDVVLADSRTGVTEMGGVCACQLADVVVMLTAANHQNIEGTRELAADLGSAAVRTLRRKRPPLEIVVVPARVEQRAPDLLGDFIARFDAAFGGDRPQAFADIGLAFHDLALPYVPEFAFEEQVTERSSAEAGALTDAFRRLADALLLLAGPRLPAALRDAAREALQRTPEGTLKASAAAPERAFDPSTRFAGFDAYLSAPAAARESARRLADWLADEPHSLRVQLGDNPLAGQARELPESAADLLHHAQALVLLADEGGISPWQRAELSLARSLPRTPRLVQVLLPGAADDAFALAFGTALADSPLIDLRQGLDDRIGLGVLLAALRPGTEAERAERTVTGNPDSGCPFPGAAAFGESDAPLFNARGYALEGLRSALRASRRVLLQGPAGCGKTSLVVAGLWPALRKAGRGDLHLVDLRRTEGRPWSREAAALGADALLVIDHADEGSRADQVKLAALCKDDSGPALLVVWRGAPLAAAEADQLAGWKDAPARVATAREHPLHHGGPPGARAMLAEALAGLQRVDLVALDAASLRAAVDAMLAQAGRRAETGLLERLFADLGELPSMAVVQRALAALWPLQARGWLTNEAYERLGGVDRLVCEALQTLHAPTGGVERSALEALLQRLVHSSADGTPVARTMDWSRECSLPACEGQAAVAAQQLARAGLLRVRVEPSADAAGATIQLRLAHLPRRCGLLDTLAAPAPVARAHVIARAYAAWADGASDDAADAVIEDTDLEPLRPWLSHGEAAYAAALQALQQRERRRRRLVAAGLAGCAVAAVAVGVWRTRSVQADAAAQARAASAAVATADVAREQVKRVQETPMDPAAPALRPTPGTPTRVVVHRSGDGPEDAALARALVDALPADRFAVDRAIEAVSLEICGDVRFHQPQDVDRARDALDRLNQALAGLGDVRRLELNDRSQTRAALPSRAGTIEVWLPPMSRAPAARRDRWGESRQVPAGCAVVGSDAKGRESLRRALQAAAVPSYDTELPLRRIWLPAFYIGRHEVTMAQFAAYQQACERGGGCAPWRPRHVDPAKEPDRPAVFVSWAQADAYCRWAGGRLPTELQWEKAARGNDGRFWPWGEQPDDRRYQGKAQTLRQPVAVGSFPAGDSPYGVADLAGNVWEMTADRWQGEGSGHTIRGGSYLNTLMESRASVRWASGDEATGSEHLGLRCVAGVDAPASAR